MAASSPTTASCGRGRSQEVEQFWADIWEYCGVRASKPYERVLASKDMPGARWFEGAQLNYAENMLMRERDPQATALLCASELRPLAELSWGALSEQVAAVAGGLRSLGVQRGDRVAAYMPNVPETLIAFLACASIGAIWSCAAPEFGARSVVDRFAQIEPKVLLVVDGYRHGGKDFDRTGALETISAGLPSIAHTVMLPYLDEKAQAPKSCQAGSRGQSCSSAGRGRRRISSKCRSTIPCGCSTPRGRPVYPRRSCTDMAASWSSS